jgi:hypothetical protein
VNERVDKDLAHGVGRDQWRLQPSHLGGHDLPGQWEVTLAEDLGLFQELERRPAKLALVEELGLVETAEPREAQLALRVVRQKGLAEEHYRERRLQVAGSKVKVAEREGFEPSVELPLLVISRAAPGGLG